MDNETLFFCLMYLYAYIDAKHINWFLFPSLKNGLDVIKVPAGSVPVAIVKYWIDNGFILHPLFSRRSGELYLRLSHKVRITDQSLSFFGKLDRIPTVYSTTSAMLNDYAMSGLKPARVFERVAFEALQKHTLGKLTFTADDIGDVDIIDSLSGERYEIKFPAGMIHLYGIEGGGFEASLLKAIASTKHLFEAYRIDYSDIPF